MAADGEVEIAVRAEGTDEAASELSDGSETGAGGGGGAGGAEGIGKSLKDIVKLLGVITAVTKALQPLLDFVEAIFEINAAFWAPVAMMLLRLFRPVLRFWLKILPVWYDFLNNVGPAIDEMVAYISSLPGQIWNLSKQGFAWLRGKLGDSAEYLRNLPRRIWEFIKDLPGMMAERIASKIPGVSSSDVGDAGQSMAAGAANAVMPGSGAVVNVAMNGGLDVLVDRIEKETGLSWP